MFGENPASKDLNMIGWALYFASTITINVVALNLLISVISNTYDNVQGAMDALHC